MNQTFYLIKENLGRKRLLAQQASNHSNLHGFEAPSDPLLEPQPSASPQAPKEGLWLVQGGWPGWARLASPGGTITPPKDWVPLYFFKVPL